MNSLTASWFNWSNKAKKAQKKTMEDKKEPEKSKLMRYHAAMEDDNKNDSIISSKSIIVRNPYIIIAVSYTHLTLPTICSV